MVFNAVVRTETRLGRPVGLNEVCAELGKWSPPFFVVGLVVHDLWRNDELLAGEEAGSFSVRAEMQDTPMNRTGHELYSDMIERLYPTYLLDTTLRIIPGPETPTINFTVLKNELMSKNLEVV